MNEIQGIARLQIHDGKLEEFKRVASQCMQVVRTKDTGTLQYELYFDEDQTECIVLEKYRDVQSMLQHQNNIGGLMDALLKTCTGSGVACGKVTTELIKALEDLQCDSFVHIKLCDLATRRKDTCRDDLAAE
jgi:quinol monooxygenase YgiN